MPASNVARAVPQPKTQPPPPARPSAPGPRHQQRDLPRPRAEKTSRPRTSYRVPLTIATAVFVAINFAGISYYTADLGERVRHPWHSWLRPSGIVGQSAGILAFLIFFLLLLYPLRKRWKALAWTGSIARWLDVHVAAALTLPLLLAIHAGWRSEGVIGLGLTAMMIVWASGIVGRYIFTHIPRAKSGVELTLDEVAAQRQALVERIATTTGLDTGVIERALKVGHNSAQKGSLWSAIGRMLTNDLVRWRISRKLAAEWRKTAPRGKTLSRAALREAVTLARREISLAQQARMLEETRRILGWWHVAHRPFAFTALIAVLIHVVVVVAVGATWFW